MHIAILHNADHDLLKEDPGREARRDVLKVAEALAQALGIHGIDAEPIGVQGCLDLVRAFERARPDLVINLCESLAADSRGEMAVPCFLDLLGLPYTGSSALALGLALHKPKAKELMKARNVPTPDFFVAQQMEDLARLTLPFPLIVKPAREDASLGVNFDSVVKGRRGLEGSVRYVLCTFGQPALIERFVEGREIYVPVLGNRPRRSLPLSEIRFGEAFSTKPHIVSYRAKWEPESAECKDSPAIACSLDEVTQARLVHLALEAFDALECRDYGRVDFRLSIAGDPYVIDVNPNCDLHPHAGFASSAAGAGLDYNSLALKLVEIALERHHGNSTHRNPGQATPLRASGPNRNVLTAGGRLRARAH